jgi:hypothetical protein
MRTAAFLLLACLTVAATPQTQTTSPTTPKPKPRPAAKKPAAKPAAAAQPAPQPVNPRRYDGVWKGTTGQGKTIEFTVAEGKITAFSAQGAFAGGGCSTTSTVRSNLGAAIHDRRASAGVMSGPGGVSFNVSAEFTSAATAQGPLMMQLHSIPGPPPGVPGHIPSCGGQVTTTWTATREGASAAELAAAPAPPKPASRRCAAAKAPSAAGPDVEPLPGTTRLYFVLDCSYGRCYLGANPPAEPTISGLRETIFHRTLTGDMQGTTYRFGLTLARDDRATPAGQTGRVQADIVLDQGGRETILASATFVTTTEEKRHVAVVQGPDPTTKNGDALLVRVKWLEGDNDVYAMGPPRDSWVEVPQTAIALSPVDESNVAWSVSGEVRDGGGRPVPGVRVMFSPLDAQGKALTTYGPPTQDGRMFINNPRPATDAQGKFRLRLNRGFFGRGAQLSAEAVVVDDCGDLDIRPLGNPLRFTVTADKDAVHLGNLTVP